MPSTPEQTQPEWRPPSYWPFVLPALIVVLAVIIFPWVFTIWMSLHEWKVGQPIAFVGLANYLRMPADPRFVEAIWHTLLYTVLSVILIVLGGLAAIPTEPYESALIDGATFWQMFRFITLPLITPFLFIAGMIRLIDALKSFDIIFAITQGGPGSASETINLYLYSVAFIYYDVGYASAIVVVFFALIVALAGALLYLRQRTHWNDSGGRA